MSGLFGENHRLIQLDLSQPNRLLGQIYIGKVKNIVKNIQAAFIELGNGQIAYYSLQKNTSPLFTKAANGVNVCVGDEIVVQVKRKR